MIALSEPQQPAKPASMFQVIKAVASGFFGVRKRADHESIKITPVQLIIVGLIGAVLFVGSLLLLVNFILSRAGAGA